ncbi:MAG: porin [Proteobacteria bacterium]|nr:porin [Pseudomonadota bacterium]
MAAPASERQQLTELQRQLAEVQATLKQLAQENRELREHERELDAKMASLGGNGAAPAAATTASTAPAPAGTPSPTGATLPAGAPPLNASALPPGPPVGGVFGNSDLRLWGYGELYYTAPINQREQTKFDLARAVFGIGYRFDDLTEFNSEYELEHAVASAGDAGEFEVEQFYIDRRLGADVPVTARAGLFLMPFGFINEHHEPTNFYGVERNFVETLIIPSTWREGGLSLRGDSPAGLTWQAGVTTGVDLAKWNFQPEYPPYRTAAELIGNGIGPLQASHQELSLANGRRLSQYAALGYNGINGLSLGAAISSGKAVPAATGSDPRVTLWEGHARWTPGPFDLSALYARGTISDTAPANQANPGTPNPIPSAFYGYFFQAAAQAWQRGDYRLDPFLRYEVYDLGQRWSGVPGPDVPAGLTQMSPAPGDFGLWPKYRDRVWTIGTSFYLGPHVVLKADYQWFRENQDFKRFDLGLGVAF